MLTQDLCVQRRHKERPWKIFWCSYQWCVASGCYELRWHGIDPSADPQTKLLELLAFQAEPTQSQECLGLWGLFTRNNNRNNKMVLLAPWVVESFVVRLTGEISVTFGFAARHSQKTPPTLRWTEHSLRAAEALKLGPIEMGGARWCLSLFAKLVNTTRRRVWGRYLIWLVVSNMNFIFHNMWDNPSHWLTHIFQDG